MPAQKEKKAVALTEPEEKPETQTEREPDGDEPSSPATQTPAQEMCDGTKATPEQVATLDRLLPCFDLELTSLTLVEEDHVEAQWEFEGARVRMIINPEGFVARIELLPE